MTLSRGRGRPGPTRLKTHYGAILGWNLEGYRFLSLLLALVFSATTNPTLSFPNPLPALPDTVSRPITAEAASGTRRLTRPISKGGHA